ncbi:amidophosphoribosyltransferase [Piscinibacter sakaiensis]|uniref:amidophosphoribosyltransferase n=1 Tax=Piscinibacter sakaiensis TaxID=1547922 RepID=UPI003AAB2408
MCGIVGVISRTPVNQLIYDALLLLQHRGQDAAGIVTMQGTKCFMHKARGMVRDVFRTRNMRALPGTVGLGQVRYPTAGNSYSEEEAQPFYVNAPFGIVLVHNGNLTNAPALRSELEQVDRRHINTDSDTEVLINVLAHELQRAVGDQPLSNDAIFAAVSAVHKRIKGSYAVIALIAGHGLLAFRDPFGIRPLCYGEIETADGREVMVASESVALEGTGHPLLRDVAPGEAIFIDLDGRLETRQCASHAALHPCMFEFVYLARPDSVMDGISVYQARLNMGQTLAQRLISTIRPNEIDVVIPIPESSRPSAMQLAQKIGKPYREGFVKNRYVGRTFIMPGQGMRKKSVRQKLNAIASEFKDRNVLLVDDSIVRGTTSKEIVQMAREAGARKVYLASAAPPVRYPNVYGIDMPTAGELIAHERSIEEIRQFIGADALIYQDVAAMKRAVGELNPKLDGFEASCFDGNYVTGDVSANDLDRMAAQRGGQSDDDEGNESPRSRLALQSATERS